MNLEIKKKTDNSLAFICPTAQVNKHGVYFYSTECLIVAVGYEGEVAVFSASRMDQDLSKSVTHGHDAPVVRLYLRSNPICLTVLAAKHYDVFVFTNLFLISYSVHSILKNGHQLWWVSAFASLQTSLMPTRSHIFTTTTLVSMK